MSLDGILNKFSGAPFNVTVWGSGYFPGAGVASENVMARIYESNAQNWGFNFADEVRVTNFGDIDVFGFRWTIADEYTGGDFRTLKNQIISLLQTAGFADLDVHLDDNIGTLTGQAGGTINIQKPNTNKVPRMLNNGMVDTIVKPNTYGNGQTTGDSKIAGITLMLVVGGLLVLMMRK